MPSRSETFGHPLLDRSFAHHPRVLRRGVIEALNRVEAALDMLGCEGDVIVWLNRYRARKADCVVPWYGIYPAIAPFVVRLHEAFVAIDTYNHDDYVSRDAAHNVRRETGKGGGRPQVVSDQVILKWLKDVGYQNSENKTRLQIEADEQLGVKKSRLLKVAKANGLTNSNRKKSQK